MANNKRGPGFGFSFGGSAQPAKKPKVLNLQTAFGDDDSSPFSIKAPPKKPLKLLSDEEFIQYKREPKPADEDEGGNEDGDEEFTKRHFLAPTFVAESKPNNVSTPSSTPSSAPAPIVEAPNIAPSPLAKTETQNQESSEPDALDVFMKEVKQKVGEKVGPKIRRDDFEDEDDFDTFMKYKKELDAKQAAAGIHSNPDVLSDEESMATGNVHEEDEIEYDADDNPIIKKKDIGPLAPLDHTKIQYPEFYKEFYFEDPEITAMSDLEMQAYKKRLDIKVSGYNVPRPVKTFAQFGFDELLLKEIEKQEFIEPTVIQKQAIPAILSGLDLIGIAKTGSGKTAAFVWPMIVHIMDQPELEKGEGPIAVICAPTRELADQIYLEVKKYVKPYGIKAAAIYGGMSKVDQMKALKQGVEVVVATPGRLIDMIKMKACTMARVTYLVLDEADRMFDMGFEPQVRSVVGQIRPDRQTLLFSATFKKKVEQLARDILTDAVRVTVGSVGEANADVTQVVEVLKDPMEKLPWLLQKLNGFVNEGSVLIFTSQKGTAEELNNRLHGFGYQIACIHGDKDQSERTKIMFAFSHANLPILVATDVAARGLDIKTIKTVINYEVARNIESHVHRIGRTGRAGDKEGVAYTLITKQDNSHFASDLVRNLEAAHQFVPPELVDIAMQNPKFRKGRSKTVDRRGIGAPPGGGAGSGKFMGSRRGGMSGGPGAGASGASGRGRGRGIGYSESEPSTTFAPVGAGFGSYSKESMMSSFKSSFISSATDSMRDIHVPKPQVPPVTPQPTIQTPTQAQIQSPTASSYKFPSSTPSKDDRDRDRNRDDRRDRDYDRHDRDRDRNRDDRRDRDYDRDKKDRDRDRDYDRDRKDRDRDRDRKDRDRRH